MAARPRRRRTRLHHAFLLGLAVIVSAAVSCSTCDDETNPADQCKASQPVIWVGGTWRISGEGKRERCNPGPTDERLEGDFTLESRLDLLVQAIAESTADAGADAPARCCGAPA